MNIDRGKTSFSEAEIADLQKQVRDYKEAGALSWAELAKRSGIAQSTLAAFASGTYKGNNGEVAADVNKWLLADATQRQLAIEAPIVPTFQRTRTAKRIHSLLNWATRGNIVMIVGDPGVGKTAAIDQFKAQQPNVWKIVGSPTVSTVGQVLLSIVQSFGVQRVGGSGFQLSQHIKRTVINRNGVLIIDEAQHLDERALEELRAIHDETKVGLAFVGNRLTSRRVEGDRTAGYAQRFSRISMRELIERPDAEDINVMLDAWRVTHARERDFVTKIAQKPGGGGLRSLSKCLELATLIAQQDSDSERCLTHIQDAWAQLSAGAWVAA